MEGKYFSSRRICHMKKCRLNKGKSGFTLVELVVVIAIIAILAAVAIPMVVGMVDRATTTADITSANEIDKACMEYKTGIIWGVVNSEDKAHSTQEDLPSPNANMADKIAAAKSATVKNALEFAGMISKEEKRIEGNNFVYDAEGRIFAVIEHPELTNILKLDTKLGVLYYGETE